WSSARPFSVARRDCSSFVLSWRVFFWLITLSQQRCLAAHDYRSERPSRQWGDLFVKLSDFSGRFLHCSSSGLLRPSHFVLPCRHALEATPGISSWALLLFWPNVNKIW